MNCENTISSISKTHDKITSDGRITPYYQVNTTYILVYVSFWHSLLFFVLTFQQKLKSLYSSAIVDAENEEEVLRKALNKINEIRTIRHKIRIFVSIFYVHLPL